MNARRSLRPSFAWTFALLSLGTVATTTHFLTAQGTPPEPDYKAFLKDNCLSCHNADNSIAGVRVDNLDDKFGDDTVKKWEAVHHRIAAGTMPPKGMKQPAPEQRKAMADWIAKNLDIAKLRPAPKNGNLRRLTVAQYRNTLRELLGIDNDLAIILPADAVSKDGFVNNANTLQLSPLLMEAYFEIAEKALNHAIVDPTKKPQIQNFRVDLGDKVNPDPLPEKLILGAGSALLETSDVLVTQLAPKKPFAYDPFYMRTKYRFIEGYRGNDTVRGWRDFDSIYHSVFADLRGASGYPKGEPWGTVPQGLLLRPAIPTEEMFDEDGTYGPRANFKISLRELPDSGRFRVTVTAAKYDDGLLLDPGSKPREANAAGAVIAKASDKTVNIPKEGIYQVDVFPVESKMAPPDATKLTDGLTGAWPTKDIASPAAAKAITSTVTVPRADLPTDDPHHVGEGDFTIAGWVKTKQPGRYQLISLGNPDRTRGWFLDVASPQGALRFQTFGDVDGATATVATRPFALRPGQWTHVAVVVHRGLNQTRIYVNGTLAAKANTGSAQFDADKADFKMATSFDGGELSQVRLYRRPLEESELAALIEPGKSLIQTASGPRRPTEDGTVVRRRRAPDFALQLGDREFSGALEQPAYLAVRLKAGALKVQAKYDNVKEIDRVVFTPLAATDALAKRFATFEKRQPRVGVHLGLRRDCGSTLAPVGSPQTVAGTNLTKYVFEGTIDNFPAPVVEKDNVNYLAGIHEIGVRSEFTDGRDMPRLLVRSVEFEGPYYDVWPPKSHSNIFITRAPGTPDAVYAKQVISNFASKAYRRPVTPAEEQSLVEVFNRSQKAGNKFQDAVKESLQAVLTSPQFLFLIEKSATPQPEPLDTWELSSKLSYFLWNSPPDTHLQNLASTGALSKQLDTEVERMINDPRFARFASEFVAQWLSLDKFTVLEADRKRYPKLTRDNRKALEQEPIEFVKHLIRNNLPARNLIQSDFVMANEATASYYDMAEMTESGFNYVPLAISNRKDLGGVLTQAAILAGLSDGRESNPVKRGAWLARKIVAEPPADPPPNVPALKDTAGLTLRQRIEQHRSVPACQQCHLKIDPWGVPFEDYDAGGRRKKEPQDSKSLLPDHAEVFGVDGLKKHLADDRMDQVAFSVLKHLATYASGRSLTYNELHELRTVGVRDLKASDYRMKDMVRYVVKSPMFLQK